MRRRFIGVVVITLALLVPLSIALANPRVTARPDEYVIQPGDTLWQIAIANDVTLEALLDANPELNPYALSIGATVRIPTSGTPSLLKDPRDRNPQTGGEYVIQAGDDLWGVSRRYNVSMEALLAANPNLDPYALTIGQTVLIPSVTGDSSDAGSNEPAVSTSSQEYVVQPGDDLWSIALSHDITFDTLMALNEGINPYALQVGQVVLLPGAPAPQSTAAQNSVNRALSTTSTNIQISPLNQEDGEAPAYDNEIAASLGQFIAATSGQIDGILPLPESDGRIEIDLSPTVEPVATTSNTAAVPPVVAPVVEPIATEVAPVVDVANLTSGVVPLTISVPESYTIQSASLLVNGFQLAFFTEPPFTYELDMTSLAAGAYNLTFTATNTSNVTSTGTLPFDIAYVGVNADDPKTNTSGALSDTPSSVTAPRQMLIDGAEQHSLNLSFSPETGLTQIVEAAPVVQSTASDDLMSILSSPVSLIPEPIREALFTPHPTEAAIIILIMTITLVPQGLFTLYHMMYTWNNPAMAEKYRSPKTFAEPQHSFTAILPARHEEDVIRQTILAVDRIDYPDHLKEVLIMVRDEDDDATIEAARSTIAELGKDNIHLITFTDGPRNKPNGLNKGLRAATKEVICVFDAEDEPHHDIYNVVNTVMQRDNADVVQSGVQLMNFRSTWFSALNCLEYFFWFKSGLHCFTHAFRVTPLGGNTVFFKKFWLDRVGGWDTNCLTEDADVGIRLTQAGAKIQIVYDERHATQEETPATVESFIKQRTRWCQGFYQVFFKGDWLKLPEMRQRITAIYILLNSLMQAATLLYLPIGVFIALTQQIAVPIALISYLPIFILIVQLITNLIGIREFTEAYGMKLPFLFRFKMVLAYYPYQLMMAVASFRAVFRFLGQQQAWEKTTHANLHRQSSVAR